MQLYYESTVSGINLWLLSKRSSYTQKYFQISTKLKMIIMKNNNTKWKLEETEVFSPENNETDDNEEESIEE